ncbi:MAG: pentapeptide repeat-containing protein [Candidatus Symbiothrix sp.]|jgi:hypothetical protein|nr:pentapeptide repeat-containing protein [Candidatus Symbiothrix sp.]
MKDKLRTIRILSLIDKFTPVVLVLIFILILFICNYECLSRFFTKDNPKGELFKVFLTVAAGIVACIALYYTAKRVTAIEKSNVDTRFNNAIGHLGNDNPAVVLGGIHVLHQIAIEHENYRQIVHNLFCSYLRENSATLYKGTGKSNPSIKCPVIIQMLIDYLFKPYNEVKNIYHFDSDLSGSVLKNCNFNTATITNCIFNSGTLTNCIFRFAKLTKCSFESTTLTKCGFGGSIVIECSFEKAKLIDCTPEKLQRT